LLETFANDTEIETDIAKVDFVTPTFSIVETGSTSESESLTELESRYSSNKNGISLSELAD